jgi:hypothetical protein
MGIFRAGNRLCKKVDEFKMSEKFKFFFLLGRPGCGKSYLYNNVFVPALTEKGIKEVERLDDFPVLQKLLDEDIEFKRHIRRDGGFQVTDWTIIDDVLKEMDKILKGKEKEDKAVLVEFARGNYCGALKNFSDYIRVRSLLVYIWAPFEVCFESNRKRFENRKDIDDHIVPEALMNTYYKTDDIEQMFLRNKNNVYNDYSNWQLKIFDNSNRDMSPEKKKEIFLELIERM